MISPKYSQFESIKSTMRIKNMKKNNGGIMDFEWILKYIYARISGSIVGAKVVRFKSFYPHISR